MSSTNRRVFLMAVAAGTSALAATQNLALAADPELLDTDPQAVALGYKKNTTQVDAKKYPKHTADQHCANCQLFQPMGAAATGHCPLFAGKLVHTTGWCSAWAKKA
ncbi:high-potential iron-sulfur protein [Polaromonas sp. C04]|uniref:high-potential iron-sulfur protein n=1 Tax=Polaromonas sp. C04 TaxID=1945857 RepID=UPI0009877D25|nr:high-potential iron-sulfur protein [Polaromonas sp. C04]OOG50444.1 iron permease [Polaromonas sp. C04]